MDAPRTLEALAARAAAEMPAPAAGRKFIDGKFVVQALAIGGLIVSLGILKDMAHLGLTAYELKRQELRQQLVDYAEEKELDYKEAEAAADAILNQINLENLQSLIEDAERRKP